jgi:SAM-dependent methyltransferase
LSVNPISELGFSRSADAYERARPGYPDDAIGWLASRAGLGLGSDVLDLAAGTGKLTRSLVALGAHVVVVEPNREMLARLRAASPELEAYVGTAEALPLPDGAVDAITVAQAFHWFDAPRALAEAHRVLRVGGTLALLWNSRDLGDPLQAALEEIIRPYRVTVPRDDDLDVAAIVAASGLFGEVEQRDFPWRQPLDTETLVDLISSRSYIAALDDSERGALLARVRTVAQQAAEPLHFAYVAQVFLCVRRDL